MVEQEKQEEPDSCDKSPDTPAQRKVTVRRQRKRLSKEDAMEEIRKLEKEFMEQVYAKQGTKFYPQLPPLNPRRVSIYTPRSRQAEIDDMWTAVTKKGHPLASKKIKAATGAEQGKDKTREQEVKKVGELRLDGGIGEGEGKRTMVEEEKQKETLPEEPPTCIPEMSRNNLDKDKTSEQEVKEVGELRLDGGIGEGEGKRTMVEEEKQEKPDSCDKQLCQREFMDQTSSLPPRNRRRECVGAPRSTKVALALAWAKLGAMKNTGHPPASKKTKTSKKINAETGAEQEKEGDSLSDKKQNDGF